MTLRRCLSCRFYDHAELELTPRGKPVGRQALRCLWVFDHPMPHSVTKPHRYQAPKTSRPMGPFEGTTCPTWEELP